MAKIVKIERRDQKGLTPHRTETDCTYSFTECDGRMIFDLRTYGSDTRESQGHASQVMQFDKETARVLYRALRAAFDFD
jgi:hypothetical protein